MIESLYSIFRRNVTIRKWYKLLKLKSPGVMRMNSKWLHQNKIVSKIASFICLSTLKSYSKTSCSTYIACIFCGHRAQALELSTLTNSLWSYVDWVWSSLANVLLPQKSWWSLCPLYFEVMLQYGIGIKF